MASAQRPIRVGVIGGGCASLTAGFHDDIRLIGSRVGVVNILPGNVRRATDRLRVTARLVDTRDGVQIWSERYDRQIDDVFAIQDEIGASIPRSARRSR
jgi:TolB-like protein